MKRAGFSLGGLMVGLVLIGLLGATMYYRPDLLGGTKTAARADGRGKTVLGAAKARAEDEVCRSNLNSVRQGLAAYQSQDADDKFPGDLSQTRLGPSFYSCPMGRESYQYDPMSGRVVCPHPGHQTY